MTLKTNDPALYHTAKMVVLLASSTAATLVIYCVVRKLYMVRHPKHINILSYQYSVDAAERLCLTFCSMDVK
jgi:hypothetical protein